MKNILYTFLFLLLCLTAVPSMALQQVDVTVSWEKVQAAEKYKVELKDSKGNLIKTGDTDTNSFSFSLAPGKYSVRITGINKFRKQEGVSIWKELEIRLKQKKKSPPKIRKNFSGNIYLGAGYSPQFIMGKNWSELMTNSMTGGLLYAGFDLSISRTLGRIPVLRNTGIEFMGQGNIFKGKTSGKIPPSDMTQVTAGGGLYYRIRTPLYFHILLHGQAGVCLSSIKTEYSVPADKNGKKSLDNMYRAGISVHIPAKIFFIDFGAFYRYLLMENYNMTTVEPFFMAGFEF